MALQTRSIVGDGAKGHHRFTLNITEDSTNLNTNQSYVSWSFVLSPIGNGWDWYYSGQVPVTWLYYINGVQYSGKIMNYDGYSTVVLDSGGTYITHDAYGNKDISFSFSVWSLDVYYLPGTASANGSLSLTYIPRQATLTSAPNFTDEQNPNIIYSNPAGGAVTSLRACIADENGYDYYAEYRDIPIDGTNYTFELTAAERNAIYSASAKRSTPLPVRFYVTTIIGGTTYYSTLDRTVTIVNASPTVTVTVEDMGDASYKLTNDRNIVINGCNYMKCTVNATANKGASIAKKSVSCGSKSCAIEDTYGILENVESGEFIFTVVDTRGNTMTATVTKDFVQYIPLTCDIDVDMSLSDTDGTLANAELNISGNFYAGNFDHAGSSVNTLTLEYRYKTGTGEYGEWTQITDVTWAGPYRKTTTVSGLDYQSSYTFQARATDKLNSVESVGYPVRTIPIYDWSENDFNFNVPVTIQGRQVKVVGKERVCKLLTHQSSTYDGGDYIDFKDSNGSYMELYNDAIAEYDSDVSDLSTYKTLTIKKDMTCLINIHVCGYPTGSNGRSRIKLVNANSADWKYAETIDYGMFTTSVISTILTLTAGTKIGVIALEPMDVNASGFSGSYIEIIEL